MDELIQEVVDHHQIRKVLAEYCNACDRCDEPRMAGVYCADSWDDHGLLSGRGVDFARAIMDGMRAFNSCSHLLGQSTITVDGDTAGAETYFLAVLRSDGEDGVEQLDQLGGRFVDELVRADGGWAIRRRTAIRDWSITLPIVADSIAKHGLTDGRRDGEDRSFAVLGLRHSGVPGLVDPADLR